MTYQRPLQCRYGRLPYRHYNCHGIDERITLQNADAGKLTSTYEYVDGGYGTNSTTPLVKKIAQNGVSFEYEYDTRGNITSEKRGDLTTTYQYDALGQLIRVNDPHENATWVYNYDRGGNILSKVKYAYTTGTVDTAIETIPYVYGDSNWKDKLTSYNGQTITYDAIGNPTNDGTWTYTWQTGRQLKQMSAEGTNVSFKYDHNGMRVQKVVEQSWYPEITNYTYHGKLLTHMTVNYTDFDEVAHQDEMHFFYDVMSKPLLVKFNEETYIYLHNSLGDIVGLLDCAGNLVVEYKYDVWGKLLSITGTHSDTLGKRNPFRYRGYIYDSETEFYYLNRRYYSPKLKRFINSEEPIHDTSDPLESNTFAYCFNDPLNNVDEDGEWGMPNWMKVAVGVVVIAGLAVATACTGGAAAVVCGAALTGALSGGAVGAASGAIAGAIEGGLDGAIDGACTGFVTGTLIGGASGAVCSGINIARGTTQIIGRAHGSLLHRFSSNMHAGRMSIFGRYSKIGLNRSLKTLGMVGRQRPDVIGIARGLGQANKIIEVVSPTQTVRQLSEKVTTMLSKNPNTVGGVVRWVAHVDRVIHFIKKLF